MTTRLVLAGCGNMGYAMLGGWLKSGKLKATDVLVVEPNEALRRRAEDLGCPTVSEAGAIAAGASPEIVVLAVKPQVIRKVTEEYKHFGNGRTTFLSVVAGTPVATFEQILGTRTPVMRCMPNTPAAIGKGMMVVYPSPLVSAKTRGFIADLLSASGEVATVDNESLMDAVTAVSGSGPAYVFHFIECLTAAAEEAGLPTETAKLLARQTVYGAASLAAESKDDPGTLRQQVTSPNGTTAAALGVLMGEDRLKTLVIEAVEAARVRSMELGE
ncbi:pyrroline-5-carboxylate reductase [Mesorhizobium sp. BE184]|uniref:pyrroline-5-carboxylate reductase n=1 Tax=Mesorhizobium sp. BE184 TaxID=2817714 RepID=UPI002863C035|nr:pyrroline-5-carboxylate reductase [Mesorhizobium sp. BE184]MDR7033090.1 pyrroline-5-carboxylate reductase [Mesorhizobium sp. BE184]